MPIPVLLTVDVPRRPPPTTEAVAYFVVSEGLTNITKHAQATQAEVFVHRRGSPPILRPAARSRSPAAAGRCRSDRHQATRPRTRAVSPAAVRTGFC